MDSSSAIESADLLTWKGFQMVCNLSITGCRQVSPRTVLLYSRSIIKTAGRGISNKSDMAVYLRKLISRFAVNYVSKAVIDRGSVLPTEKNH